MVSASQIINPLGAQVIFDGGIPRTYTGKAIEAISGGYLVQVSGATGDVGSAVNSYVTEDLNLIGAQNVKLCNGIALNNAASGGTVTFATRGAYLSAAQEIISGGAVVGHNASGGVVNLIHAESSGTAAIMKNTPIGRALTTSASGTGNFALISYNL